MANTKKLIQAAAGAAGGAGLNVEDVFTNWLYTGDDSTTGQTIQNGVDYTDGEERLVWIKARNDAKQSVLVDTVRGANKNLSTANNTAEDTEDTLSAFTSNGFTVKHTTTGDYAYTVNRGTSPSGATNYASWTFRKAPKFFDVVTYTGDGSTPRAISHSLGSVPGMIVIKKTNSTGDWSTQHRSLSSWSHAMSLNSANSALDQGSSRYPSDPTSTSFYVGNSFVVNGSGQTYVAYLFAHNDGDGEFGPTGDQDIIKCGSYTGSGAGSLPNFVNLGFEPQWVMIKNTTDSSTSWAMFDSMRALNLTGEARLLADSSGAEYNDSSYNSIAPTPTGFNLTNGETWYNKSGSTYIYIAIRRGPMAVPESATDVFDIATRDGTEPHFNSNFDTVDFALYRSSISGTGDWYAATRLTTNKILVTNSTAAEIDGGTGFVMDFSGGWYGNSSANSSSYSWMWKRAPNFFDVVCWNSETGSSNRRVTHNLGVAPEMVIVRRRDSDSHWYVYHKDVGTNNYLRLNTSAAQGGFTNCFNTATDTDWGYNEPGFFNYADLPMLGYFFASLDGISKVGSYTGDGTTDGSNVIDCGFSAGARFVLVKRTDAAADWALFDSERGIISGNDPRLFLSATNAQTTSTDFLVPNSSGFAFKAGYNESGASYIFYAVSA